jgi:hypothetical protein
MHCVGLSPNFAAILMISVSGCVQYRIGFIFDRL